MADSETPAQQAYQISTESMRLLEDALKELCKTANTVLSDLRLYSLSTALALDEYETQIRAMGGDVEEWKQALFEEVYHNPITLRDAIERCLKRCAEGKEPKHG